MELNQEHSHGFSFPTTGGRILLDPDPTGFAGAGNAGDPAAASAGQPASLPDSGVTESGDTPPVNGGPTRVDLSAATIETGAGNPGGGAAASPADPNHGSWVGLREAASARGFQFDGSVTDEATALDYLLRQAQANRQADYYAQLGRQLAPQAPAIQQYLQTQRQPAQPERPAWAAPEFDQRWVSLVDRDPSTGVFVGKPGTPHAIVEKVNAYADWKQKFDTNPEQFINQAAEARAREIAESTFKTHFAEHQRQATIQGIMTQNASFLYQVDQAGNRMADFQGQPMLTPVGARYVHYLGVARQMGVSDPAHQDSLAKQLVRGEHALAVQQQALPNGNPAANPQTNQQFFRPNVNPSAAAPPQQRRTNPALHNEPSDTGLTLRERLLKDLKEAGVTDGDIMSSHGVE